MSSAARSSWTTPRPEAPAWHVGDPTWRVEVAPGQRLELQLEAHVPAPCRVHGRVTLPFPVPGRRTAWDGGEGPRVTLERPEHPGFVSRSELAPDGTFTLAAYEAARYRLRIDLDREDGPGIVLDEWLDLAPGDVDWTYTLSTGEVELVGDGPPFGGWLVASDTQDSRELEVRVRVQPRIPLRAGRDVALVGRPGCRVRGARRREDTAPTASALSCVADESREVPGLHTDKDGEEFLIGRHVPQLGLIPEPVTAMAAMLPTLAPNADGHRPAPALMRLEGRTHPPQATDRGLPKPRRLAGMHSPIATRL